MVRARGGGPIFSLNDGEFVRWKHWTGRSEQQLMVNNSGLSQIKNINKQLWRVQDHTTIYRVMDSVENISKPLDISHDLFLKKYKLQKLQNI